MAGGRYHDYIGMSVMMPMALMSVYTHKFCVRMRDAQNCRTQRRVCVQGGGPTKAEKQLC